MSTGSQWSAALAVARKELREGLRDRQTVLYTFLLPVAMYPVLFWVMVQGALLVRGQKDATNVRVELRADPAERETFLEALTRADDLAPLVGDDAASAPGGSLEASSEADADPNAEPAPAQGAAPRSEPSPTGRTRSPVGRLDVDAPPEDLDAEAPDLAFAAARLAADDDLGALVVVPRERHDDAPVIAYHDSTRSRSSIAVERVRERLAAYANEVREAAARARDVDIAALEPLEVRSRDLATSEEEGALALSLMLPMLLIVMAVMGSFFPAVDLTAGEKERRTAETTLLLPIPRTAVHLGKILAVSTSGMIATTLNLVALGLSAGHLLGQLGADVEVKLPLSALAAVAPLALLFVFFVSAVLTGFAGLAASFKEGQALLGPVQMIFIFPAMAASLPGLGLTYGTALIPVVNVALAFRELLVGHAELGPVLVTAAALFVYALVALRISVRILSREGVALAGETIPLKRLLGLLKGDGDTR
ncbi:MAG: ABC transporter permease subunit [Planctomycetota bacterium]